MSGRVEAEFRAFVEEYGGRLAGLAWTMAGGSGTAEDVLQAALAKTLAHWHRARATDPYAYARRALVTTVIDEHRRLQRQRRAMWVLRGGLRHETGVAEGVELASDLQRALASLAPRQRAVIALRYLHDMSEADVAATLDISIGSVKSMASRALPRLRAALTNREGVR